ncbi:MAG: DUF3320 domain-containing protein [Methanobacterium sp.]|jgi:superfamily I DNA and/or RNA helicase
MAKTSSDIKEQLNVLQKNLLDLTMRNQLLNFRPRSRVIKVFDEIPTEIYEILVLNEKKMQFSPKPEKNGQIIEEDLEEYLESNDDLIQNKSELLWELPRPDTDIQDYYKDNVLQTKLTSQELQKRLFNIYQQAKSVFDEQGYNILYLVLGLLEWKEAEQSEDIKKAPLILIPIFMERKGVKRSFKIEWTGDDILTNISLQSKLKEQGIKLPSFEMPDNKDGIYDYFQSVEESIKKMKDWNVRYEIYLGFFSFTKFVMYQDLEAENWPYGYSFDSNPIVKDLFIPNDVKTVTGFNEHEVDVKLPAREIFTVSDADSSQIAVIEDVKKGNNLVVEGPPGTGKSQTIVNLIAELIASGKTVLFVSEKMAALEVVKSRLDSVGLGDFCLELHSRKSNKKEVLKELERTLKFASQPLDINEDDFNVLDGLRTDLNNYPNIIHKPYGKIGFTPFQLFGLKEDSVTHFNKKNKQFPVVNLPDPLIFNKNDWDKSLSKLSDISELLNFIKPIKTNTWKSSNPDLILPAEQQKIKTLLESLLYQLETIEEKSHEFSQKSGVFQPNNLDDVLEKGKIARKIIKSDVYPEKILKNRVWDKKNNKATEIINQIEIFNELKSKYLETALDENVKRLLSDFENKFIGLFNVTSDLFSTNEIEIRDSLNSLGAMIDTHMDLISNLLKLTGIKRPLNQLELEEAMETISKIVTAPKFDVNLIQDSKWDTFSTEAQQTISLVHEYIENKHILEKYREDALDENIKGFLNDFIKISAGLFIVSSELFSYYESEIRDSLSNLNPIIEILINEMESLSKLTGIRTSFNENELEETLETISILIKSPQFNIELVQGTEWNDFNHNATKLINLINLYQQSIPLLNKFQSDVLDHDLKSIRNEFKELTTKKLKFLRRDYKRSRKIVSSFYFDIAPKDDDVIVHDLGELIHCQEIRNNIRDSQSVANSLFGDYWDDEKSDPETLKNIGKWLNTFRTLLNQGKITQDTLKIKEKGLNQLGIEKSSAIIKTNFRNIKGITNRLREFIIFKSKNNEINFKDLEEDITTLNLRVNNYFDLKANLNNLIVGETIKKDEDLIEKLNELIKFQDLRNDIENSENTAKSLFGDYWEGENSAPETLKNIGEWLNTFRTLLNQGKITQDTLEIKDSGFEEQKILLSLDNIRKNLEHISQMKNKLSEFFVIESVQDSIKFNLLKDEINSLNVRVNDYFDLKANLNNLIVEETIRNDEDLIEKLNDLIKCQDLRNDIENSENTAKSLFGDYWEGENSDPETLKNIGKWLNTFRTLLNQGKITRNAIKIVSNPSRKKLVIDVPSSKSITNFLNDFKKLNKFLKINNLSSDSISRAEFPDLKFKLERYNEDLPKLVQWSQFTLAKKELPALAQPMIEIIDNDILDHDDLLPAFKGNYADHLLKKAFTNYPELRNFVGVIHEKKIREFNNLDQKTLRINRIRVAQRIRKNIPHSSFNISKRSERGILENEFSRKRGHMPIRRLLYEAGSLIKLIKPCFMMSPLSVAQFIDPNGIGHLKFDVVIFDEASQVKPEDALGTLLRGEQLVVMGDTKQLPPTSFFDNIIGNVETDDYELSSLGDMESILHLCKRSFPAKMLRWHYRSRHESLIAVSNQEFYDNHLFIYPSPEHQSNDLGLKYVNLDWQHASYDRGRSSVNLGEAKAIVKAAFKHFDKYGDSKSLGIGTFNVNQQRAIQEILELELRQLTDNDREKFESYFNQEHEEKFFIKNLETIQGDERDVIFVSVGFGFESTKKFSYNFGPLNREGGERRLNVLLTRAREKCVIYSNFRHSDLEIRHNSPFGLKALKTFLAYAENKELLQIDAPLNDFDSPFEESVYELLRSHGYVVHKQVGCAGYRIDLAVVDPKIPGKYLLGIECDGAMYHSSEVARDRDRLRQQVLEGLGWNIYRIWSTDWYKSREESIDRLLKAVKDSKTNPNSINHTISESTFDEPEIFEKQSILVPETKILDLKDTIPKYEIYKRLKISTNIPLHEKNPSELANAINRIVKFESPVHVNEVFRRIRDHWKIKRTGNRIKDNLDSALKIATQKGKIQFKNDFLYFKNKDTVVRLRTGDPPPRIDLISDEEIEKAIIMVIDNQFATEQKDLILQVSRLLGFKTTRGNISERINSIIKELLSDEELVKMPNGMINLPNS